MTRTPLSELELARLDSPGTPDDQLVLQLAQRTLDELALEPPINHEILASIRDIIKIEEAPIPWAGFLAPSPTGLIMTLRQTDPRGKKRFTAFHEVLHTYLPGFTSQVQYRCDPTPQPGRPGRRRLDTEGLCDIGAAELLFPRTSFAAELAGNPPTLKTVEELADRHDASLEATARRVVALHPDPAMLIALEPGIKPSAPHDEPQLRVVWADSRDRSWPYVPRYKSVPHDSPLGLALDGEVVEDTIPLALLTGGEHGQARVSARLYPYVDDRGEQHMRVLALLTRARRPRTNRAH